MDVAMIWGIVPLYFALLLNELTATKANFRTAIQTGFSFLWAAAQWLYFYAKARQQTVSGAIMSSSPSINLVVTCIVLAFGLLALYKWPSPTLSQIWLVPWPHALQQLFHDYHLSNSGSSFRLDLGTAGRYRTLRGTRLARAAFRPHAFSRRSVNV